MRRIPINWLLVIDASECQCAERAADERWGQDMAHYCDTVGIDLGTTRSCVAVWDGTQVWSSGASLHAPVML
jgi:hypothetical protein